jgi:hypothetical protein
LRAATRRTELDNLWLIRLEAHVGRTCVISSFCFFHIEPSEKMLKEETASRSSLSSACRRPTVAPSACHNFTPRAIGAGELTLPMVDICFLLTSLSYFVDLDDRRIRALLLRRRRSRAVTMPCWLRLGFPLCGPGLRPSRHGTTHLPSNASPPVHSSCISIRRELKQSAAA